MRKRRKFTRDFKLSILNEIEYRSAAEVCREHDLLPNLVSKWKTEYNSNPKEAFSGSGNLWKEDAKIAQYERLIGRLYAEIDLLKKTLDTLQKKRAEEKGWSR